MDRLKGKTAVVTGGNSGIGFATAELFLKEGANVIITGRRADAVKSAVEALGKNAKGIVSDAGKMNDVKALPEQLRKLSPTIDIVFANAGVALFSSFDQTTEEAFDTTFNINFKGVYFTLQGLLPMLAEGGSVILNSTILVHSGLETSSSYSASKGAILSLGKTLAIELAARNIRVNTISPGPINTPIYSKMGIPEEGLKEFAAGIEAKIPLRRFGNPKDIAQAALFLASHESNFITGSEIMIDGGKAITF